jgi:glutamate racemase
MRGIDPLFTGSIIVGIVYQVQSDGQVLTVGVACDVNTVTAGCTHYDIIGMILNGTFNLQMYAEVGGARSSQTYMLPTAIVGILV